MNCGNCKHWNKEEQLYTSDEFKPSLKISQCTKAIEAWEATEWTKDEDGDDVNRVVKEEYKNLKMFTKDGSSYAAYLYTRQDFYCAHYETEWKKP